MKFNVICLFPELISFYLKKGILAQCFEKKISEINLINLRDFAKAPHYKVDFKPYGGFEGMLLGAEVCTQAFKSIKEKTHLCLLSAQGKKWDHQKAKKFAKSKKNLTLFCARYAGVDQRFINSYVDEEISIGDYVLMGGELSSLVLIESICRFIPGVLGDLKSAQKDSFEDDFLLQGPLFTKPDIFEDKKVPLFLKEGNHEKIKKIHYSLKWLKTFQKRADLIKDPKQAKKHRDFLKKHLSDEEIEICGVDPR